MSQQKTIIVTGTSQGIGAAVAEAFLSCGYNVVATSHNISKSNTFKPSDRLALVDGDIGDAATAAKVVEVAVRKFADAMLVDAVRAEITALPTYGYCRASALVNLTRSLMGLHPVNHKRMYRVMKTQGLLLPKSPRRSDSGSAHDGTVMVEESNQRWCSDGFKIACDNSEVVTGVFMKD